METIGYAALSATTPLETFRFRRRDVGRNDVEIDILFCGICHTDIHIARNEWKGTAYPVVPGHEIVGRVVQVGKDVRSYKPGQIVAVGCMVGSCGACPSCRESLEQYCEKGPTLTYNSRDKVLGGMTYGGYSKKIIVNEAFVLRVPETFANEELPNVAPLLCAGITTYSPLKHWNIGKGDIIGVVGLGGLGHMAVKIAHALGAHVVVFTTSPQKRQDALRFGAQEVVVSKNADEMQQQAGRFKFIIDTVAAPQNLDTYLELLKRDGTLCLVGVPGKPHEFLSASRLIHGRRSLAGSLIGGIKETQEMLDFCAANKITSDVECIPIQKVNEAYERVLRSDVRYRFVIDMSSLSER